MGHEAVLELHPVAEIHVHDLGGAPMAHAAGAARHHAILIDDNVANLLCQHIIFDTHFTKRLTNPGLALIGAEEGHGPAVGAQRDPRLGAEESHGPIKVMLRQSVEQTSGALLEQNAVKGREKSESCKILHISIPQSDLLNIKSNNLVT